MEVKGKSVLIVGLGALGGGVGSTIYFARQEADVTVTDLKTEKELCSSIERLKEYKIRYVLGKHDPEDFAKADIIIRNPAVAINSPILNHARVRNIPIHTAESYFLVNSPTKYIIGITGTRGKSTTSAMVHFALTNAGYDAYLGGNMKGTSTLRLLDTISDKSYVILELSSWQLASLGEHKISPWIAAITNIYPDHLNFYSSMDEYITDKKYIYAYQNSSGHLLLNKNNEYSDRFREEAKSNIHYFCAYDWPKDKKLSVLGRHNLENAALAVKILELVGVSKNKAVSSLSQYTGLNGRLETVGITHGVAFINDTTSTTPIASIKALRSFPKGKIILLTGGNTKKLPLDEFVQTIQERAKAVVLFKGNANLPLRNLSNIVGEVEIGNMREALELAVSHAKSGDTILFSPGLTHLPLINEFARGDIFNHEVQALAEKENKKETNAS